MSGKPYYIAPLSPTITHFSKNWPFEICAQSSFHLHLNFQLDSIQFDSIQIRLIEAIKKKKKFPMFRIFVYDGRFV